MSPQPSHPSAEGTAECIRGWVAKVDRAADPMPMALPHLAAGDSVALARITLRTINEGIAANRMGLARLALVIGATAERAAVGRLSSEEWGTEAQVRVGLALIDCTMRATGWFSLASAPDGSSRALTGPRLVLAVQAGAMDAVRHRLRQEVPDAAGYRPTIRGLAPPYRIIRTIMDRQSLQVSMIEAAEDLPGG